MNMFEPRSRSGVLPYVFGMLLGISLGLIIISGIFFYRNAKTGPALGLESSTSTPPMAISTSRRNAIVAATERVAPAVVSITSKYTRVVRTNPFRSSRSRDWLERFFGIPETSTRQYTSLGSGVIISPDGYILTNEHVLRMAEDIEVTLSSGEVLGGHIIDTAPEYDLAVVKVDGQGLPSVSLGDSDSLLVGEWAIAIGQPFGQLLYDKQPTVTVGVISALHRNVKESRESTTIFKDMIQTDAAINPGNSGGPLVDSNGNVIGINTFIFSAGDGGNVGMGFAIPINRGKWVVDEIRQFGRVRVRWVGLTVLPVSPELAARYGLASPSGLLVREIEIGSPADQSGLKGGDIIIKVNGRAVTSTREANRIIYDARIGDRLKFQIVRGREIRNLELELVERPNEI